MSHRFFLESKLDLAEGMALADLAGTSIDLDGDQAHHAINVMRFKVGDEIVLFDGSGFEHLAKIQAVAKKRISVSIVESHEVSRSLKTRISIAVALPKGDRQKFLIEKLVELGVEQVIPLKTRRAVAVANTKVIQRLQKQVVEASKQCGRNRLLEITETMTVAQLINLFQSVEGGCQRLLADPYSGKTVGEYVIGGHSRFVVAVGPEGGFDESELTLFSQNGFESMTLGPSVLRIETACVAVASILGIGRI